MNALTTIVPDEALLLEVARSAAARHLKLLTNGRRTVLSPVDIPGFKPIIVKEKAMQATIRIEIEDEALRASVIGETITAIVQEINQQTSDFHYALDQARERITKLGYGVYRGGNHIAVHHHNGHGGIESRRLALIS